MSEYIYSALGHGVRCPNGDHFMFYYSENNGEWMVRGNGHLYYADQLALILNIEEERLSLHLSEVS